MATSASEAWSVTGKGGGIEAASDLREVGMREPFAGCKGRAPPSLGTHTPSLFAMAARSRRCSASIRVMKVERNWYSAVKSRLGSRSIRPSSSCTADGMAVRVAPDCRRVTGIGRVRFDGWEPGGWAKETLAS